MEQIKFENIEEMNTSDLCRVENWEDIKRVSLIAPRVTADADMGSEDIEGHIDAVSLDWDKFINMMTLREIRKMSVPSEREQLVHVGRRRSINQVKRRLPGDIDLQVGLEHSFEELIRESPLGAIRKTTLTQKFLPREVGVDRAKNFIDRFWDASGGDFAFFAAKTFNRGERSSPLREFPGLQAEG